MRTLIDQATELTPNRLERLVNEADKHDVIDPEELRTALDDHAGERGVKPLRILLDRLTFRLSDTELEVLLRDALRDQTHTASGLTTLRFSHYQVAHEPDHVRQILTETAANLRPG